jgi:hypothetical protein
MASFEITAVRTERTVQGPHEHVTRVWLHGERTGEGIGHTAVIEDLRSAQGDRYYVHLDGRHLPVTVTSCPYCMCRGYLTTLLEGITANRLLELERL